MKDERGQALIIVLLIVAILVAVVVEFAYTTRVNIDITMRMRDSIQAKRIAVAALEIEKGLLTADLSISPNADYPVYGELNKNAQLWSQIANFPLPVMIKDKSIGIMRGLISDESGKFDLNALIGSDTITANQTLDGICRRLFEKLKLDPNTVDAIEDWIDSDELPRPYGAESEYYEGLDPAYRAKDAPLDSITELKMIKGIDEKTFNVLMGKTDVNGKPLLQPADAMDSPLFTVFPKYYDPNSPFKINVNTASPVLLAAMYSLDDSQVQDIISTREQTPFLSIGDFTNELTKIGVDLNNPQVQAVNGYIDVKSDYFSVDGIGIIEDGVTYIVRAVYYRNRQSRTFTLLYWREEPFNN
ncbi:MAG: general secretion pathway protein GspK [Deltaproteobacteria bacterium]|nr:general secretion pathway protein GspK [Deltaproteobacteria bacterium]